MELVIFEQNKPFVLEALGNGEFDYMEAASEVFEADFFCFIKARSLLDELAASYPTFFPRYLWDAFFVIDTQWGISYIPAPEKRVLHPHLT